MKLTRSYTQDLIQDLKAPKEAAAYLNAVLEEGDRRSFLLALRQVVEAFGGMSHFSRISKIHRVSLYKMFSKKGNPEFGSLMAVLHALGISMTLTPLKSTRSPIKKAA